MPPSRRDVLRAAAAGAVLPRTRIGSAQAAAPAARIWRDTLRVSDGTQLSLLRAAPASADSPTAATLLFIPGWTMPASLWSGQLAHFGARYPCVAFDPRGQGESEVTPHGYTIARRVADLHEVIAREAPLVLVGWSLAVLEALHYVHLHGEDRLRALVLVDNSIGEPPAPKPSDFTQQLRRDREATVDRFVRGMFAASPGEARIEEIKRSALRLPTEDSIALLSYPLPREHWRRLARGFRNPLAYIVTPRFEAQAQSLKAHRPATRIEVFRDAKHALFVDQPERFNQVLESFIDAIA